LARRAIEEDGDEPRNFAAQPGQDAGRAVRRSVVDHDRLERNAGKGFPDLRQEQRQVRRLVAGGMTTESAGGFIARAEERDELTSSPFE
jgi:hypothetical protein